ncbi:hypothetical protein V1522DRAFT_394626 [Lipomyces starkeyi]
MPISEYTAAPLFFIRFAQIALAMGCLATANVSTWTSYSASYDNGAYYVMTVSVWTFLTTPYLIFAPMYLSAPTFHKLVLFAIELLTNVFWFTGFIVLLAVYNNFYNGGYFECESKVAIAIAVTNWVLFVMTSTIVGTLFYREPRLNSETEITLSYVAPDADSVQTVNTSDLLLGQYRGEHVRLMNEAPAGGPCGEPTPPAYDGPANMPECDGMSDAKPCHGLSSTSGYNATSSE